MSRREKDDEGPSLHKSEDPVHLEGETTWHKGNTQGTSLCRLGSIGHVMSGMKEIMRMKKNKWGRYALPKGFAECRYPKSLSCRTTSKNMTDHRNPSYRSSDYLQAIKILGGSRATAMQSLQLHLTGAAWSWLSKLPNDSIGSWGELENQFTRNFRSTYTRPTSIEEVKSYTQKSGEALRLYIQR
jgi:hypothetical protein